MSGPERYISITGLELKRFWHALAFWVHAMRSMAQARAAAGNIRADARTINGVHHTLSVWTDRAAMRAFLTADHHAEAMRVFPKIATGKTFGFTATEVPDWPEMHRLWRERGCVV
jgi:quinol monooxygenase YgiN